MKTSKLFRHNHTLRSQAALGMATALAFFVCGISSTFSQVIFAADFAGSGTGQLQTSSASVGSFLASSPALPNSNVTIEDVASTTAMKVTRDTTTAPLVSLFSGSVPSAGDVISVDFSYYVSDSGDTGGLTITPGGTSAQRYAGVLVRNVGTQSGTIEYINDVGAFVSSSESISLDTWYNFELEITFVAGVAPNTLSGTYSGYVTPEGGSQATLFENQQMREFTDVLDIRGSIGNQPEGFGDMISTTYWNGLSIEVVPEPHAALLLGMGLSVLALRRKTRS